MTALMDLQPVEHVRGQEPLFLSQDAVALIQWAKDQPAYRDSFSRVARPEQVERFTLGPREHYAPDPHYPNRLNQGWYYPGQWCQRQVSDQLGWDEYRHRAAKRELRENGYARESGWFKYELTERGWDVGFCEAEVIPVCA